MNLSRIAVLACLLSITGIPYSSALGDSPQNPQAALGTAFDAGVVRSHSASASLSFASREAKDPPPKEDPDLYYPDGLKKWTVTDSIGLRYFSGGDQPELWASSTIAVGALIKPAPDGKYFHVVTHRGEASSDSNLYELAVFAVGPIRMALAGALTDTVPEVKPLITVTFRSSSSEQPAIKNADWESDASGILFLGMTEERGLQLHRLDIASGSLEQLTDVLGEISYLATRDGGIALRSKIDGPIQPPYPMRVLERDEGGLVLFPSNQTAVTYVGHGRGPMHVLSSEFGLSIAPGGREAVVIRSSGEPYRWDSRCFALVDLAQGRELPMRAAEQVRGARASAAERDLAKYFTPAASRVFPTAPIEALWSEDGRRVILVDTPLPVGICESSAARDATGYVVSYEPHSGRWQVLERMISDATDASGARYVSAVSWGSSPKELLVSQEGAGRSRTQTAYTLREGRWIARPAASAPKASPSNAVEAVQLLGSLSVFVRQSANDPPLLMASNGHREMVLMGADPALQGIWHARVEAFQWREPDGTMRTGGLLLPRNVPEGQPLPLVMCVQAYEPDYFLPDGSTSAACPVQALVARGMAVAQIPSSNRVPSTHRETSEGPAIVDRVDASIEFLAARRVIDPSRIGLSGFSRTGHQTLYVITHPGRTRLAAAVVADTFGGTYSGYLRDGATIPHHRLPGDYRAASSGTFWTHKPEWLRYEPTFNVDRVRTPALFTSHGPHLDLARNSTSLDIIGAFHLNDKPLEYLYLPYASHNLLRPRERLAEAQAVVDWMAFWLQDKVPADPDRAARWDALKAKQRAVLKQPALAR